MDLLIGLPGDLTGKLVDNLHDLTNTLVDISMTFLTTLLEKLGNLHDFTNTLVYINMDSLAS